MTEKETKEEKPKKTTSRKNIQLGLTLKALREYSNLSIEEASKLSKVKPEKITKIEEEGQKPTKTQLLNILSSYGGLDLNEIFEKKKNTKKAETEKSEKSEKSEKGKEQKTPEKKTLEELAGEVGHRWKVYTDGSCVPNPGKGAWAYVILCDGEEVERKSGFDPCTTNNIMEMTAMINGITRLSELGVCGIVGISDSQYVIRGITSWVDSWVFSDPNLTDRLNGKLWLELYNLRNNTMGLSFKWVKGHNGNEWNELCDSLCEQEYYKRGLPSQVYFRSYKTK